MPTSKNTDMIRESEYFRWRLLDTECVISRWPFAPPTWKYSIKMLPVIKTHIYIDSIYIWATTGTKQEAELRTPNILQRINNSKYPITN